MTCSFASLKTFGASDVSHGVMDAATSGVQFASTAVLPRAKPTRAGRPPSIRTVTPTSSGFAVSQVASSSGAGSVGTGAATAAAAEIDAICCSMPASSATRGMSVLNSRRAKMSRTACASIGIHGAELGPVPPLAAGRYMRVTVQDTGHGMDESMRVDAIGVTEGDQRGLAGVLELLRRIHGALWLDSARSLGTRAFLYLPVDAEAAGRRRATVLLVEDETAVRSVVRRMLLGQGFAVREARDGEAALRMWHAERAHIRAVVTDVVMPVMGGRDLARELRLLDRDLPVLFISAYAGDEPGLLDGVDEPRRMLPKPFTNEGLLEALRGLLAESA